MLTAILLLCIAIVAMVGVLIFETANLRGAFHEMQKALQDAVRTSEELDAKEDEEGDQLEIEWRDRFNEMQDTLNRLELNLGRVNQRVARLQAKSKAGSTKKKAKFDLIQGGQKNPQEERPQVIQLHPEPRDPS